LVFPLIFAVFILDLTRLLPGPLAGRMLAEMGYQVLKLEPPSGDLMQTMAPEAYAWLNQGKTVQTLDLKSEAGVDELKALVKEAVALLETNRPGVMERLGVGPLVLRAINPALTYVRIAGYRQAAFHQAPGHDLAYLAADGLLPRFDRVWPGVQLADSSAAFWAVIAVQQGMLQGGGFFEVYLAEAARAMAYPKVPHLNGGVVCYGIYLSKGGKVALTALEAHLWSRFCQALDKAGWEGQAFSPTSPDNPVYRELLAVWQTRSAQEWEDWATEQGIPLRMVRAAQHPDRVLPWKHEPE
jgi:crotonobetainyl-CoA:carnitine CoA-transferase CaiB-like acyl-CoA transferase